MSERLAVSATISVLMMSIYVLFGSQTERLPLGPSGLTPPSSITAPGGFGASAAQLSYTP